MIGRRFSFVITLGVIFLFVITSSAKKCNKSYEITTALIKETPNYSDKNLTIKQRTALLMKVFQFGVATAVLSENLMGQESSFSELASPSFYTKAYRWLLRHLSLWPSWLKRESTYMDTHHVWKKRQEYSHYSLPGFIKTISSFWDWSKHDEMEKKLREFEMDFMKNES